MSFLPNRPIIPRGLNLNAFLSIALYITDSNSFALFAQKMMRRVLCISPEHTVRADIEQDLYRTDGQMAMKDFKTIIFGGEDVKLDNRVFPTCEEGDRANICVVFDSKSNTEGHNAFPENNVANSIFMDTLRTEEYTFHGTVVMFHIDKEGTSISEGLRVAELGHIIRSMRIAIDTHQKYIWQAAGFSDLEVTIPFIE